jgi:hypothetical protein
MPYYLRFITSDGKAVRDATPAKSIEVAMTTACAALRHGATNAWVEDENGKEVADFQTIKRHCGA